MGLLIKAGKAIVGAAVVLTVADNLGPKLPEVLVIKGVDTRRYVAGGGALLGLMMIPFARQVAVPAAK